ncbi:EAL domain-containing response regulator [Litchfieldella rifensis]|uniref:EAL domain-containing protein n=1 Tax=Litchfieldella rifensis TaxID=762643 RepID=A0ABV7LL49_9GAMM
MPADTQPLAAILDDDPDVAVMLSLQLRVLGMEACCYREQAPLLAELPYRRPRMVILALEFGQVDGIAVLRRLAELEYRGVVLLLSGVERKIVRIAERVGRALGLTILDSLSKPYRLADLRRRLDGIRPRVQGGGESRVDAIRSPDEIELALAHDEFIVHYQPQYELANRRLSGVETLVRWQHPGAGLLYPGQFLHLMAPEQCQAMTRHLVALAMRDAARWSEAGLQLSVSVNVTPAELMNVELLSLMGQWRRSLAQRSPLVLEITETGSMDNDLLGSEVAARLHLLGLEVSVDDFGIGFSSLSRLQLLPISELKLDRSFVRHLHEDVQDAAIVEAVALLGQRLGIRVVAEGVESLESLEPLQRLGCTHVQGFALARPMPAEAILALACGLSGRRAQS